MKALGTARASRDLHHIPLVSSERQHKSRTSKWRFAPPGRAKLLESEKAVRFVLDQICSNSQHLKRNSPKHQTGEPRS